jgi:hypothetical protein
MCLYRWHGLHGGEITLPPHPFVVGQLVFAMTCFPRSRTCCLGTSRYKMSHAVTQVWRREDHSSVRCSSAATSRLTERMDKPPLSRIRLADATGSSDGLVAQVMQVARAARAVGCGADAGFEDVSCRRRRRRGPQRRERRGQHGQHGRAAHGQSDTARVALPNLRRRELQAARSVHGGQQRRERESAQKRMDKPPRSLIRLADAYGSSSE